MKIENYKEQAPGGYAQAIFDVYLPGMSLSLRNIKLCLSKKGHHFLGYPCAKETDETGKDKWTPHYEFSSEKKKDFEKGVFEELKNFVRGPLMGSSAVR